MKKAAIILFTALFLVACQRRYIPSVTSKKFLSLKAPEPPSKTGVIISIDPLVVLWWGSYDHLVEGPSNAVRRYTVRLKPHGVEEEVDIFKQEFVDLRVDLNFDGCADTLVRQQPMDQKVGDTVRFFKQQTLFRI